MCLLLAANGPERVKIHHVYEEDKGQVIWACCNKLLIWLIIVGGTMAAALLLIYQ